MKQRSSQKKLSLEKLLIILKGSNQGFYSRDPARWREVVNEESLLKCSTERRVDLSCRTLQ
ncbi:MAG: hypothetical protein ACFFD4_21735 [Candidatus Odinarchaeota archaeon]